MERYKQTVGPTLYAVSLDELKSHVGAEGYDEYDGLLATLRDAVTEAVGKRCRRQIMSSTFTLTLDAFPAEIIIDTAPVSEVTTVAYTDADGDAATLTATTDYQTDLSTNDGPATVKPAYGVSWPSTQSGTYGAVVVTFKAGCTTAAAVPDTIKHEICMLVAHWFRNREGISIGDNANEIPQGIEMLSALNDTGAYQ